MPAAGRALGHARPFHAAAIGFALVAACAGPGCRRRIATPPDAAPPAPPAPALGDITVEDDTPPAARPPVAVDVDRMVERVRAALRASGQFAPAASSGPPRATARVRVGFAFEEIRPAKRTGHLLIGVELRVEVRPKDGAPARYAENQRAAASVDGSALDPAARAAAFARLLDRTVDDLLSEYTARLRLAEAPPAELVATLRADAGELRVHAIRAIADRRLTAEIPQLLALLEDAEEAVRDAALGALVELRERRAVAILARRREMLDGREMRKIIDAIGALGGEEANDYLSFVAEAHDDDEIRRMAAAALARMQRRAATP